MDYDNEYDYSLTSFHPPTTTTPLYVKWSGYDIQIGKNQDLQMLVWTASKFPPNINVLLTSSGEITSLKFRRSSGSGNSVSHVLGNSRSRISEIQHIMLFYMVPFDAPLATAAL